MSFFRNNNSDKTIDQPNANNQNQSNYEVNSQQGKKEGKRWWRITDFNDPIDQVSANIQTHSTQVVTPTTSNKQTKPRQNSTNQPIANTQTQPSQRAKSRSTPNALCIPLERIYQTILELKIKASTDEEKRDVTVEDVAGQLGVTRDAFQKVLKRNHNITYTELKALTIEQLRQIPYYNQIHPSFKHTNEIIKLSLQDIHNAFARQETALLYQKNIPKAAEILSQQYSTEISARVVRKFLKEKFPFLLIKFDLFLSPEELKQKVDTRLGINKYEEKHEIIMYRKINRQRHESESNDIEEVALEEQESTKSSTELSLEQQLYLEPQLYQQPHVQQQPYSEPQLYQQPYLLQQQPYLLPQSYLEQQTYAEQQTYQPYIGQQQTTSYAEPINICIGDNNAKNPISPSKPYNDTTHLRTTVRLLHSLMYGKPSFKKAALDLGLIEADLTEQLHLKNIANGDMLSTLSVNAERKHGTVFDEEIIIKRALKRQRHQLQEVSHLGTGLPTNNTNTTSTTKSRKTNKQKKQKKEPLQLTVIDYNDSTQNDDVVAPAQSPSYQAFPPNLNTTVNISPEEVDFFVDNLHLQQLAQDPNLAQDFNSETLDFMRFFNQSQETQSNVNYIDETLEFDDKKTGPK